MRRADRLFQIIQYLRSRRITTAQWLAERLEVSERTVYRDINDLMLSGVPVEGEAGVGYVLRKGFDLPPLMFTTEELTALTLGARIVKSWADPELVKAAEQVLSKVETVLPSELKTHLEKSTLFSPMAPLPPETGRIMQQLRAAIDSRHKVAISYTREDGASSERTIWPLGLFYWGAVWTLGSWCELRESFRNFRLDRIDELEVCNDTFPDIPGRNLQDLIALECGDKHE